MKKKVFLLIIILCITIIRSIVLFDFAIDYLQNDEGFINDIHNQYSGFEDFVQKNQSSIYTLILKSLFSENIVVHLNRFMSEVQGV